MWILWPEQWESRNITGGAGGGEPTWSCKDFTNRIIFELAHGTNKMHIYREIYFNELTRNHWASKPTIFRVGHQVETQGRAAVPSTLSAGRVPSYSGTSVFFLSLLTDWMRPIQVLESPASLKVSWIKCCCCCCSVTKLCLTFCDPMNYSLPGSSVHRISQARILEWVAMPSSSGSSDPGIEPMSSAWQADSLPLSHLGNPPISNTCQRHQNHRQHYGAHKTNTQDNNTAHTTHRTRELQYQAAILPPAAWQLCYP